MNPDNVVQINPPSWMDDAPEWTEMPEWAEPGEPIAAEPIIEERWPEPVDLWSRYQEPKLPANLLPDSIDRFARRQAAIMGADAAGMAMAALTVCATAIPNARNTRRCPRMTRRPAPNPSSAG